MKKPKISTLQRKADKLFSDYIRERDNYTCITCGKVGGKSEIDAGHFVDRYIMNLRYDERNVHAQCKRCNRFLSGHKDIYSFRLVQKYGADILFELEEKHAEYRREAKRYGRDYYEAIIRLYGKNATL